MRRGAARQVVVIAVTLVMATACATTDVTLIGAHEYAPLPESARVAVFSRESEVDGPFEAVATINVHDPGKYQVLTLQDAMPELMDKARAVGANALIIDHFERVWSGVISSGVDVQARAIRWTREAASPVPRATAREIDLSACARIFERIGDLANTWVENHPDRAPLPSLPSRDAFLSVCGQLPDDAQLCLNRTYDAAHHDACTAKLTALPTRDRLLLDRLFLEPSESEQ